MRLLSLEVEHFRAIQSARLQFGRGLNVIYGPNDNGKSTLTEAIRAALLVAPGTAEARFFSTWGAAAGLFPRVVLGFESQGAIWRVEKVFAQGSRVKAQLEKSTDGGARYHAHAQGRDVEGKLRELLNWGLAPPGGRGSAPRSETYLTTALLGKQGEVGAIFQATLKRDQDDTGRTLVTRALDALGQDPIVTRLLDLLKERAGEAYTKTGRHKRGADSPLVRAQAALREREDRLRDLQEAARQGKEIEEEIGSLMRARDAELDRYDQARTRLGMLRRRLASVERRTQLWRDAALLKALEAAQQEYLQAQDSLTAFGNEWEQAVRAASDADAHVKEARDRLARAEAANASSEEIRSAALAARVSDLRARLEKAEARRTAVQEWETLQSRHAAAKDALAEARQNELDAAAELSLATALDEEREAAALTETLAASVADHVQWTEREATAATAAAEAHAAVRAATAGLENARSAVQQAQRSGEAYAMNLRVFDTRILNSEAVVRDERDALERARSAVLRERRAHEAQAAAKAAEARAAEIESSLAANAAEVAASEARLRALELAALELRRRATASRVDELRTRESVAREQRRGAADARDRAAALEAEVAGIRFPSSQYLASLRALHAKIKSRRADGPAVAPPAVNLILCAGAAGAVLGFAAARYGLSAGTTVSIGAALFLFIFTAAVAAFACGRRRKRGAEVSWRTEIEQLESRLALDTAEAISEAGVRTLEEIEPRRQEVERLHPEAGRLRQEATALDREADAMFETVAGLSSVRREWETLNGEMALLGSITPAMENEILSAGLEGVNENTFREKERLSEARRVRDQLQTERMSQVALCALKRANADSAAAERVEATDSQAVADAESRFASAEEKLAALREERERAMGLPQSSAAVSETELRRAEQAAALAERRAEDLRREHQEAVRDLARATARLELARCDAEKIRLSETQERVAAAREKAARGAERPESDAARMRHKQAEARVATALANVELLAAGIPEALRKAEPLVSVAAAEEEQRRLQALLDVEGETPQDASYAQELKDAEEQAGLAGQHFAEARLHAAAMTSKQGELRAQAERARGEFEASRKQTLGLDREATRLALAEVELVPEAPAGEITDAESALEAANAALTTCEGRLNEVRGKLGLVAGRVGLERVEEEQEAVERAKEYAEEQELDFEAARYLLELLEAEETKRSSHLGRCLATPVTQRFLALTGDLYAQVQLDPDLQIEGFVAEGGARHVEELSVGTREQLATIVRLAIAAHLKTTVLLDDQLVHSDSGRLEWFRQQLHASVRTNDHQIIVMTCRLEDYVGNGDGQGENAPADGPDLTIINVTETLRRLRR